MCHCLFPCQLLSCQNHVRAVIRVDRTRLFVCTTGIDSPMVYYLNVRETTVSVCVSVCVCLCLSVSLSPYLYQSICPSVRACMYVRIPVCQSVCLPIFLTYLYLTLSESLTLGNSRRHHICFSFLLRFSLDNKQVLLFCSLFVSLYVSQSVRPSVYIAQSVCLSACLSVCLKIK